MSGFRRDAEKAWQGPGLNYVGPYARQNAASVGPGMSQPQQPTQNPEDYLKNRMASGDIAMGSHHKQPGVKFKAVLFAICGMLFGAICLYAPGSKTRHTPNTKKPRASVRSIPQLTADSYSSTLVSDHLQAVETMLEIELPGSAGAEPPINLLEPQERPESAWSERLTEMMKLHQQLERYTAQREGVLERARGSHEIYEKKQSIYEERQRELQALHDDLDSGPERVKGMAKEIAETQGRLTDITSNMQSNGAEDLDLRKRTTELTNEVEDARRELGERQQQLSTQKQLVASALNEANEASNQLASHNGNVEARRERYVILEAEATESTGRAERLKRAVEELQAEVSIAQNMVGQSRETLNMAIEIGEDPAKINGMIAGQDSKLGALRREIGQYKAKIDDLSGPQTRSISSSSTEIRTLMLERNVSEKKSNIAQETATKEFLLGWNQRDPKQVIHDLREDLRQQEDHLAVAQRNLQEKLSALEQATTAVAATQRNMGDIDRFMDEATSTQAELQTSLVGAQDQLKNATSYEKDLATQVQEVTATLGARQQALTEHQNLSQGVISRSDKLREDKRAIAADLLNLKQASVTELMVQKETLHGIQRASAERMNAAEHLDAQRGKLTSLLDEISNWNDKITQTENEIKILFSHRGRDEL